MLNEYNFEIVESEAMPIQKSQYQTYQRVGIGLTNSMTRALLYVAMSRVTSINNLYLFGLPSIQAEKFQKLREVTRQKQIN